MTSEAKIYIILSKECKVPGTIPGPFTKIFLWHNAVDFVCTPSWKETTTCLLGVNKGKVPRT